jgi:chaperonin GroEL
LKLSKLAIIDAVTARMLSSRLSLTKTVALRNKAVCMTYPRLAFEPVSRRALRDGFNQLADMMAVALGPRGRLVAVSRDNARRPPELLDDGAVIARRFSGLSDRFASMGALLARHIAWQVEEAVGDGATTAVVLARAIVAETDRYLAAGHNAMLLRRGLESAAQAVSAELGRLAQPLDAPERIRALATSITRDETLGKSIEEVFDVVGPNGAIDVRTHFGRGHNVRYINGVSWNQGWASSYFTTDGGTAILKEPYILFANFVLSHADELLPALEAVRQAGSRGLVVIAPEIREDALSILVANKARGVLPTLAIKAPGLGPEKTDVLHDLAVMTGGRVIVAEKADRMQDVTLDDLGQAREVQAIRSGFTVIGGKGRPAAMRARSQQLRSQIPSAAYGRERNRLVERAGKLLGGMALLEVGAASESERDFLKDRAAEAVHVVRLGLQGGVVPGGGAAFLACVPALERLDLSDELRPGARILAQALGAPMHAILQNSGFEPEAILATVRSRGNGTVYDVVAGEYADSATANIVDPLKVLQVALETAVSGALMAVTTSVLVHKPRSNRSKQVDFRP